MKKISLLIIVALLGLGWTFYMKYETAHRYDLSHLQSLADSTNQTLPKLLDSNTQLDTITVSEKRIEQHHTLILVEKIDIDLASFKIKAQEIIEENACSNPHAITLFENGVEQWFTYQDKNNQPVISFKIDLSNKCANLVL